MKPATPTCGLSEARCSTLAGVAAPLPDPQNFSVTVTLASDLGRRTFDGAMFRFTSLAPGAYEIYVEAHENPPGTRFYGGYTEFRLERNTSALNVLLNPDTRNAIQFSGRAWPDHRAPQGPRGRRPHPGTSALGLQSRFARPRPLGTRGHSSAGQLRRRASLRRRVARGPMAGTRFSCRAWDWLRSPFRAAPVRCTAS